MPARRRVGALGDPSQWVLGQVMSACRVDVLKRGVAPLMAERTNEAAKMQDGTQTHKLRGADRKYCADLRAP